MKYEKWSLGYQLLKIYVWFALWLVHKKMIVTGKGKIPKNKPIVLASNHQNALSDPLAIVCKLPVQAVWLTRADVFKARFTRPILRFMKMIPVYRIRDGKENLEKNDETFIISARVLENNFVLALFPEAAHSSRRQMIPHKKAVPRIVFLTEEKNNFSLDIQIVPIGIYYSHYWNFGRTLIVNVGDPLQVLDYSEAYKTNPQNAIIALRDRIFEAILPLTVDFRTKNFYGEFEKISEVYGDQFLKKQGKKQSVLNRFYSDQVLARKLDQLETTNLSAVEEIAKGVDGYFVEVKKYKLRDWLVDENQNKGWRLFINLLVLVVGLPIFIYGALFNILPFVFLDRFIKEKVKDPVFWSSFFIGAGILLFPVVYGLELIALLWLIPGLWLRLAFLASLPFAGKLAFSWYILLLKTLGRFRFLMLKWFNPLDYKNLLEKKSSLITKLDELITDNFKL